MKIKKIINIKNLGVFDNYKSDKFLEDFKRYNLIYGWNASGKTTLSKLFQSLVSGENEEFKELKYKIEVDNKDTYTEQKPFSEINQKIKVFNKDYISENIHIEESEAKKLIFLDTENKQISDKIKDDKSKLTANEKELANKKEAKQKAQTSLDKEFTDIARTIAVTKSGMEIRNYKKPQAEKQFQKLFADSPPKKEDQLTEKAVEEALSSCKNNEPKKSIELLCSASISKACIEFLNKSKELCSQKITLKIIDRLKKNPEISVWVENGLTLYKKYKSETCEFCNQNILKDRINSLEGYFNTEDQNLKKSIDIVLKESDKIKNYIGDIELVDTDRFYEELRDNYEIDKNNLEEEKKHLLNQIDKIKKILMSKKEKTNEVVDLDLDLNTDSFIAKVESVKVHIVKHNEKTKNLDKTLEESQNKIEKHYLASIFLPVEEGKKTIKQLSKDIDELAKGIKKLKAQLKEDISSKSSAHKLCGDINSKLSSFLGRNEILFEVSQDNRSYLIKRNGKPAKNLSEGEKTAIALVYFLVSLKEEGIELSKLIVFIDDPISSLDSNSMFQASAFIEEELNKVEQLFISTHNMHFFKKMQSWLKKRENHKTGINKKVEFFMIKNIIEGDVENNQRSAKIENLDPLIKKNDSEYQYLFCTLQRTSTEERKGFVEYYPMANMARKFLETFLSFKIPSKHQFSDQLKELFNRASNKELSKKIKIEHFLNEGSHYFPNGNEGFDFERFLECKEILKDILQMIEDFDSNHYNELCDCCKNSS